MARTVEERVRAAGAPPPSCTMVIFGASGDLTKRKLLPALYHLAQQGLLPKGFALVGMGGFFAGVAKTPIAAIVIQAYPFFLLHEGKPEPEFAISWFGGLLMGWLCWRAGCMWPSFLLHWSMYVMMEVTAFVYRNGLG